MVHSGTVEIVWSIQVESWLVSLPVIDQVSCESSCGGKRQNVALGTRWP